MTQISFDPLTYADEQGVSPETAAAMALGARDRELRARRKRGEVVTGWALRGQLRKYRSFGVEDGRVRTVYYITVHPRAEAVASYGGSL